MDVWRSNKQFQLRILLNPPTTDQPTHRPKNHRPTDKIIFSRLDNRYTFVLQIANTAGKMKNYTSEYSIWIEPKPFK